MKTKKQPIFRFIKAVRDCKNYNLSTPFNGIHNRRINNGSVKAIAEKIEKYGFIGYVIILQTRAFGKKEYRTADGQHRIEAAQLVNAPFNYELIELIEDTKQNVTNFIAAMNSVGTRWSNNNHLDKQVELGVKEYILFDKCLKESNLKITDLLHIFLGGAGTKEVQAFKDGVMKFEDVEQSFKKFQTVKALSSNLPNKAFSRRALYKTMKVVPLPKLKKAITGTKKLVKIENEKELETAIYKLTGYKMAA